MPPLSENIARLNIDDSKNLKDSKSILPLPFFHSKKKAEFVDSATLYEQTTELKEIPTSGHEADDEKTEETSDLSDRTQNQNHDQDQNQNSSHKINMGRKLFIPELIKNNSIRSFEPTPIKLPERVMNGNDYNTLLESYNNLLNNHRLVLNEFQKVSTTIDDLIVENRENSTEIQNTYSNALRNQADYFQDEIKSLKFQLACKQSTLNENHNDQEILIQWVKSLFCELERASKSGELSTQLKTTSNSVAKILQEPPIDKGKLQLLYRSFVETLSFKKEN